MGEAEKAGAAGEKLERARERLNEIWTEWGVALDTATSKAQVGALAATMTWLEAEEPWRAVRAVQYLLCDPETPGVHKRRCWTPLKKALLPAWENAATRASDVQLVQALLLAAWPESPPEFPAVELLGHVWNVQRGRETQRKTLVEWRERQSASIPPKEDAAPFKLSCNEFPVPNLDARLNAIANQFSALETAMNANQAASNWRPQLIQILTTQRDALLSLKKMGDDSNKVIHQNATLISGALASAMRQTLPAARNDLLWWGQARYSHLLRKPYRRFERAEDVTFWAPFEAATLTYEAETAIEPAASYVVEVLRALDRDVNEKRSLRAWMASLLDALQSAGDKAPPLSRALAELAAEDAIGLPVTWVRLRARESSPFEGAEDAVALPLDEAIDRGEWAAWIFRESLLDLALGREEAP